MTPRNQHLTPRDRLGVAIGPALVCAACLYVSYWIIHSGLALSYDSIHYLNTAVRLNSLHDWSRLSAQWPPIYPILVNLFLNIVPWPGTAAALLNAFCLTATLLVTWYTCFQITRQSLLSSALAMLCLASPVTYWVLQFAWSENPYALFIALHILFIWLDIRQPRLSYFALALLCAALAFLTRYVGICTLATGSAYTLWRCFHTPADRVRRISVLLAAWGLASTYVIHNLIQVGRPFGSHGRALARFTAKEFFDELGFCSVRIAESLMRGSGVTVVLILIALTTVFILTRILNYRPIEGNDVAIDSRKRTQFLAYLLLLMGAYYTIVITQLVTVHERRESIDFYRSFRHIASSSVLLPVVLALILRWATTLEPIAKQGFRLIAAASAGILLSGSVAMAKNVTALMRPEEMQRFWRYGSEPHESLDEIRSFMIDAASSQRLVHIANGMLGELQRTHAIHYRSLLFRKRFLRGSSDFIPKFQEVNARDVVLDLSAGANRYRIVYHDPNGRGFESAQALADHVGRIMSDNEIDSIVVLTNNTEEDNRLTEAWSAQRLRATAAIQTGKLHWIQLQRLAPPS